MMTKHSVDANYLNQELPGKVVDYVEPNSDADSGVSIYFTDGTVLKIGFNDDGQQLERFDNRE